jgi:two-component system response regulator RstA
MNKIVYVEDEPEVGQLIAAYLGKHDMDVIVEPRGDRAEEVVVRENPDLVLLDIMLPGKDGMTLCRDLRARWEGPIVLLTSLDSDMNHILSLEMGANDYILKTTPPAVLLARLRLHLRQHASVERESPALSDAAQSDAFWYAVYRSDQPPGAAFRRAYRPLHRRL